MCFWTDSGIATSQSSNPSMKDKVMEKTLKRKESTLDKDFELLSLLKRDSDSTVESEQTLNDSILCPDPFETLAKPEGVEGFLRELQAPHSER